MNINLQKRKSWRRKYIDMDLHRPLFSQSQFQSDFIIMSFFSLSIPSVILFSFIILLPTYSTLSPSLFPAFGDFLDSRVYCLSKLFHLLALSKQLVLLFDIRSVVRVTLRSWQLGFARLLLVIQVTKSLQWHQTRVRCFISSRIWSTCLSGGWDRCILTGEKKWEFGVTAPTDKLLHGKENMLVVL